MEDFWIVLEVSQDPDLLAVSKAYCGTFKICPQNLWHSSHKRKRPTLLPLNMGLTYKFDFNKLNVAEVVVSNF